MKNETKPGIIMKTRFFVMIVGCLLMWPLGIASGRLTSNEVMDRIEARYNVPGIFVRFQQTSSLKALDVIDSAEGRIYIKQPGKMRWEYDSPEKQSIITNGDTLWIHRPEDNQVMTGKAATFFGDGMGGVFLSDMTAIRRHFRIELTSADTDDDYTLELNPVKPSGNIQVVFLTVSKKSYILTKVVTRNAYGDETTLTFENPKFDEDLPDGLFEFFPPEGMEVLSLEE